MRATRSCVCCCSAAWYRSGALVIYFTVRGHCVTQASASNVRRKGGRLFPPPPCPASGRRRRRTRRHGSTDYDRGAGRQRSGAASGRRPCPNEWDCEQRVLLVIF
jgi:hypothetical protein